VVNLKEGHGTAGMLLSDDAFANKIRQTVTTTTSDVQDIVADLKAGRGPPGMLLRDEALAGQIREVVKNGQQATTDLGHASRQADALVSDLSSRRIPQKADEMMDNLNDSSRQVRQLIADIVKPDSQGLSAGNEHQRIAHEREYREFQFCRRNRSAEAQFFDPGFFKSEGYYNLAELSPEEYRTVRAFTSPANRRVLAVGNPRCSKRDRTARSYRRLGKKCSTQL